MDEFESLVPVFSAENDAARREAADSDVRRHLRYAWEKAVRDASPLKFYDETDAEFFDRWGQGFVALADLARTLEIEFYVLRIAEQLLQDADPLTRRVGQVFEASIKRDYQLSARMIQDAWDAGRLSVFRDRAEEVVVERVQLAAEEAIWGTPLPDAMREMGTRLYNEAIERERKERINDDSGQIVVRNRAPVKPRQKSWTTADADSEIQAYKAARSSHYTQWLNQYANAKGATKSRIREAAREVFGRNALSRELDIPAATVSGTPAWDSIDNAFDFTRGRGASPVPRQKQDFQMALAEVAGAQGDAGYEIAAARDELRARRDDISEADFTALSRALETGEQSPKQVLETLAILSGEQA